MTISLTNAANNARQDGLVAHIGSGAKLRIFYRIYKADGTTPVLQGSVTATGGGGDLELNTVSITVGGPIAVTAWTLTDGN